MKVGLDDFLAGGGSVEDLFKLAADELRPIPGGVDGNKPYFVERGCTYWNKETRDGPVRTLLANFSAQIIEDVIEDDGAETRRIYGIRAVIDGRTLEITVPADRFMAMNWPAEQLGPGAIVTAGLGSKDKLREAIQVLSPSPIPQWVVHRHLGWIQIGGKPAYLHARGAIGPDGPLPGVDVRLDPPLDRYVLPDPPTGEARREAVRASLRLLAGLATDRVMFPLFSFLWTTVIRPLLESLHLTGKTGARKTELLALAQRHHGAGMDAQNLPGSWASTANLNEALAFLAADSLLGIDDYSPSGSATDIQRQNREADRVFRGRGNASGRGRLRPDGTPRPIKPFRAGIASTGEDVPHGHSMRARLLVLEVGDGEVNLDKLTECQSAGEFYPQAMAAYVQWLAGKRAEVLRWSNEAVPRVRQELLQRAPHGRTATACAKLILGLRVFLIFAKESGAIDDAEMHALDARGRSAILAVLADQAEHQAASDPAQLFVHLLGSAIRAGEAHLTDRSTDGVPMPDGLAMAAGWRRPEAADGQGGRGDWHARGSHVGWIDSDDDSVYLDPQPALRAAQKQGDASPNRIGIGERALWERLHEAGLLISEDRDRHTKKVRIGGRLRNALHLRLSHVLGESGTTGTEPDGGPVDPERADEALDSVPDPLWASTGTGTDDGNAASPTDRDATTAVPDVPDRGEEIGTAGEQGATPPCRNCGETRRWRRRPTGALTCARCHPPEIDPAEIEWIETVERTEESARA